MSIIPDWAPNLHPLVVHFPIALLFIAALMDTIGLMFKNEPMWRNSAFLLYVLGTLGAVGAFYAGKAAGDSVFLATEANALLTDHADMAKYTVYFFGGYALLRIIFFFAKMETRTGIRAIMYFLGIGGLALVWATADRGGQLVFKYGVGVAAVGDVSVEPTDMTDESGTSAPQNNDKGGWSWKPTKAAAWIPSVSTYGTEGAVTTSMQDGGSYGDVLALTSGDGSPVMFTFDYAMQSVQLDSRLNLDGFTGSVMFVHHVIDAQNYSFVSVSNEEMKIGRSENGDLYLLDSKPFSPTGWQSYRMVSDQTHFRAYADQKLIVHGHGDDPGSGFVGIRLNGTGTVLLDFVQTVSLRGEGMDGTTESTPATPAAADTTAHKH
ncbi:MAG: hypothetical protein O3B41_08835 [Bacteroidetes bacterium]|nr:hypothetical protein [Bacteroidota bacterium]